MKDFNSLCQRGLFYNALKDVKSKVNAFCSTASWFVSGRLQLFVIVMLSSCANHLMVFCGSGRKKDAESERLNLEDVAALEIEHVLGSGSR